MNLPRPLLVLVALASAACAGVSRQHAAGADVTVHPTRVVVAASDTLFVLEAEVYDLIARDRAHLRERHRIDAVATRYRELFDAPPPRAAILLVSDGALRPELVAAWIGVPMAVALPNVAPRRTQPGARGAQRDSSSRWPSLEELVAQTWLFAAAAEIVRRSLDSARLAERDSDDVAVREARDARHEDSVRAALWRAVAPNWFFVAATNLIATPDVDLEVSHAVGGRLADALALDTLFAIGGAAHLRVAGDRASAIDSALRARRDRVAQTTTRASKSERDAPSLGDDSILDVQATSVLQFLRMRDPAVASALIEGLSRGLRTAEILERRTMLPRGITAIDKAWRQWVRAISLQVHPPSGET